MVEQRRRHVGPGLASGSPLEAERRFVGSMDPCSGAVEQRLWVTRRLAGSVAFILRRNTGVAGAVIHHHVVINIFHRVGCAVVAELHLMVLGTARSAHS